MTRRSSYSLTSLPALFLMLACVPLLELFFPESLHVSQALRTVLLFSLVGLGLTIVTGFTGMLMLGCAAFMAIGVYTYAIVTSPIYPFQIGFWFGILVSAFVSALSGLLLGIPAVRLKGDYLAIVTLGFGEIIQDLLRNLDVVTKGTQGINPLATPTLFAIEINSTTPLRWYYLLLSLVALSFLLVHNLQHSPIGRIWGAIRDDELAARSMGIPVRSMKLLALACGAALCGFSGALSAAALSSTGEPGNYDFNISIISLCIVIVGGLGSLRGVFVGALIMIGINSVVLTRLAEFLTASDGGSSTNVIANPINWKYLVFGLALILTMRLRPQGLASEKP